MHITLSTSKGDIILDVNEEKSPISAKNFASYVDKGFYDGLIFHRVIKGFMVQTGGFLVDMKQKSGDAPIKNEWKNGLTNVRGSVAMARTQVADSASSQFFINTKDNSFLSEPRDGAGYAVFGQVVKGMDVVDAIEGVATTTKSGHGDVPREPVVITKARRSTPDEVATIKAM